MNPPTPMSEAMSLFEAHKDVMFSGDGDKTTMVPTAVYDLTFPMGVFGTLREGHGNNRLMHRAEIALHCKAFMPHFLAHGLSISFHKNCTAPFEVFFYRPEEWRKMIPSVDSLEGFSPKYAAEKGWGYHRTLAWIHLLPADYTHELFPDPDSHKGWYSLGAERDLRIPQEEWAKYERVPCWVYSNRTSNERAREAKVDTVIWDG